MWLRLLIATKRYLATPARLATALRGKSQPGQGGASATSPTQPDLAGDRSVTGRWRQTVIGWLGEPVKLGAGDAIVLLDTMGNRHDVFAAIHDAQRAYGTRWGLLIHDLFPVLYPALCQAKTVDDFNAYLDAALPRIDFFIANSRTTRQSIEAYLAAHPPPKPLPGSHFHLGASLESDASQESARAPLSGLMRLPRPKGLMVLAVGTIEPRKNYPVLLDAFDRLQDELDITLVIVGRPGWQTDGVQARIRSHVAYRKRLHYFPRASNPLLSSLFSRADALVCASLHEGFGLPVVEGLHAGLTVLASDIPVFREIGGDRLHYFAPDSSASLARAIREFAQRPATNQRRSAPATPAPISWAKSAEAFLMQVQTLASR